jgi:hypothetical protein
MKRFSTEKIELMFENGYLKKDVAAIFPTFYKANIQTVNLLYTEVLDKRLKSDPTLTVQKDIDIYKSRQDQIQAIGKRRTLRKGIKKEEKKKENEEDSNIHSYKRCKAKKDFESSLNNKIKKAEEQR